jgi:hypothetical protein
VDLKDANNCPASKSITVGEPPALTLDLNKSDVTCNGGSDGSVTATFGGGTPPYQAQIDGGGYAVVTSPKTFSGLSATSHTVDLKDANNCPASKSITVGSASAVTLDLTKQDVSCHGGTDGTVTATFSGGTPPYQAQIDGGGYAVVTSPKTFSGLSATSHTVDVKDANNCPASKSITVGEPDAVTLDLTKQDVSCNGGSDGTVTATFGGGTPPYQARIDGGSYAAATSPKTFSGLGTGSHTVDVKDANNCPISKAITVGSASAITLNLNEHDVSCNGSSDGTVTATFSGGTPPYQARIDGGSYAAATSPKTFSGLGTGSHTVDVKDANSCTASKSISVGQPDALALDLTKVDVTCQGQQGKITATFSGGTAPYSCQIDGGSGSSCTSPDDFTGLGTGSHTVKITDANGCNISKSLTISSPSCGQITPTQTTCTDFTSGTAGTITQLCFGLKSGQINNVAEGVFFYYTKITSPGGTLNIVIDQANDHSDPAFNFALLQGQVRIYDANCGSLVTPTIGVSGGDVSFTLTGTSLGQVFIISLKYDSNSIKGLSANPNLQVTYQFSTQVNGSVVDAAGPLLLKNCVGGASPADVAADASLQLYRPTPNPFGSTMRMAYEVGGTGARVEIGVYDLAGRRVRQLVSEFQAAGINTVTWDGRGDDGTRGKNGVYFIRSIVGSQQRTVRIAYLK